MAFPKSCWYFRGLAPGALGSALDEFARDVIDRVLAGHIDGSNVHDSFVYVGGGLGWKYPPNGPKQLYIPALDGNGKNPGTIRRKGSSATNPSGLELHVKASDSTYGRVCVVDSSTPTVQRISLIPDDPASVASPGGEIKTPTGALTLDTGGAFNVLIQRNNTTQITVSGTVITVAVGITSDTTNTDALGTSSVAWSTVYTRRVEPEAGSSNLVLAANTGETFLTLDVAQDAVTISKIFMADAGVVINDAGADNDFRAEGDTDTNLIFLDASTDRVGIGTGSPGTKLDVNGVVTFSLNDGSKQARGPGAGTFYLAAGIRSGSGNGRDIQIESSAADTSGNGGNIYLAPAAGAGGGTRGGVQIGGNTADLIGFYGHTPAARPSAYTPTNVTTDRSYDADATTLAEVADVLGTLIADLQGLGLLQ